MSKNGGSCPKLPKNIREYSVDKNREKTGHKTVLNLRSDYIQIYGKSRIAEKTIKKEKIL